MAKKSKLTAAKLVRERARATIGPVPPTRRVPDKRSKPSKHKLSTQAEREQG